MTRTRSTAFLATVAILSLALPALAGAPELSPRPPLKEATSAGLEAPVLSVLRPEARPKSRPAALRQTFEGTLAQELRAAGVPGFVPEDAALDIARARAYAARSPQATALSLRPLLRPKAMVQKAMARQRERARGAVCGSSDIQGEVIGYVPGRINGCGIEDAVKVRAVSGVTLSQQATIDCTTARALRQWVDKGLKPAVGRTGGGVTGLRIAAHYACRGRNNQPGAKISEHGKGRAIDISGVFLRDGSEISVLGDWHNGSRGRALQKSHRAACGIFGTTLGPGSDGYHEDHLHFDTARYRSGSYCR